MEPFTFTRQTAAFLGVLAALELLFVLLFPLLAVVAAALAFALLVLVWVKAGLRTGKWLWWNPGDASLTAAEGALASSAALLIGVGLLVAGYEGIRYGSGERTLLTGVVFQNMQRETPASTPAPSAPPPPQATATTRATHYGDPGMQLAFKDALAQAGIPFSTETRQGKEFVSWRPEDNAAVEDIQSKLLPPSEGGGRSVHFEKPQVQQAYKEWLVKRGVEYSVMTLRGREYVVWKDGPRELAMQFLKEYYPPCPEAGAKAGKKKKAAPANC